MCGMVQVRLVLVVHAYGCVAQLFNNLMMSLGYPEYVTQGGDLGHMVRDPHTEFLLSHMVTKNTSLANADDSI